MLTKWILHALAVIFTILVFLIRRAVIKTSENPPSRDYYMSVSNSARFDDCASIPKYKKDPDISCDDEVIGKYPQETEIMNDY